MKTILFLILISFLFIGCEKEQEIAVCIECVTTATGGIYEQVSSTTVTCGSYTPKEIEQSTRPIVTIWCNEVGDTITYTTECKIK